MRGHVSAVRAGALIMAMIVTPQVCASTQTGTGDPVRENFEDWCGWDIERWVEFVDEVRTFNSFRLPTPGTGEEPWGVFWNSLQNPMAARPYCAYAGSQPYGAFVIEPHDPPQHTNRPGFGIESNNMYGVWSFWDSEFIVRVRRLDGVVASGPTLPYWFIYIFDYWGSDWLGIEQWRDGDGTERAWAGIYGSAGSDDQEFTPLPDSIDNWQWVRFKHVAETNTFSIATAPFCGDWITRVERTVDDLFLRRLSVQMYMQVEDTGDQTVTITQPGFFGPINPAFHTGGEPGRLCRSADTEVGEQVVDPFGVVCVGADTQVGVVNEIDGQGLVEDWCSFPSGWEFLVQENMDVVGECANFWRRLAFRPDQASGIEQANVRSLYEITMRDHWVAFRLKPTPGASPSGSVEFFDPSGDAFLSITWSGSVVDMSAFGSSTAQNWFTGSYDPSGAHAWIRFRHDATTNTMYLETAPFCGPWVVRDSGTIDAPVNRLRIDIRHTVQPGSGVGSVGPIYLLPTNPGNGGGS
jgi:hypothetical protein